MFAQASAAIVAASRTAELPVSVRRNCRSGVSRFRPQAVLSENDAAAGAWSVTQGFSPMASRSAVAAVGRCGTSLASWLDDMGGALLSVPAARMPVS